MLAVSCPTFTLSTDQPLTEGTVAAPYIRKFMTSGGTAPYTFKVIGGALPDGLILNTDGSLIGLPTAANSFDFTVQVTDKYGCSGSRDYKIVISE